MKQLFDVFNQADPPGIFLCNPNKEKVGSIGRVIYETNLTLRFNAVSEFTFKIPQSIDNKENLLEVYSKIKVKRLVFIEGVGYFIIVSAVEESDGSVPVMTVDCQSLESELSNKKLNVLSGTFKFYDVSATPSQIKADKTISLMGYILSLIPNWTLDGTVNATLASTYRTFDVSDNTIYNFLMTDVEKAYGCVFFFDTINRKISVKKLKGKDESVDEAVTPTDIFISYDNLVKQSTFSEMSDEIVTAMNVYGGNSLDIRSVNPLGTDAVYDFTYYKNTNWMTQSLVDAITAWENKVILKQPIYDNLLALMLTYYNDLAVLNTNYTKRNEDVLAQEVILASAIESKLNNNKHSKILDLLKGKFTTGSNDEIVALSYVSELHENLTWMDGKSYATWKSDDWDISGGLSKIQSSIDAKNLQITSTTTSIQAIVTSLSFETCFNTEEYKELLPYIIENTYQNENIIVKDTDLPAKIQETKKTLYDQAIDVLERVHIPRYEFTVDAINFVNLSEFSHFTNQILPGVSITINTLYYPIVAVLLELKLSYDKPEDFSLTFSNRLRLDNGKFQYSDLAGQVVKTGGSVSFDKPKWSNWATNYKDDVTTFINSALDTTKNQIINSTDQEIVINGAGLRGKHSLGNNNYAPEELWLTSNNIAFTDNNWLTSKTALGKILIDAPTNTYAYGIVADYLVGKILIANDLTIANYNNSFTVNSTGATLSNAMMTFKSTYQGNTGGLIINPNDSTAIMRVGTINAGVIANPSLSIGVDGSLSMNGNLTAGDNYIHTDGTAKIGALTITKNGNNYFSDFTGTISADKLDPGVKVKWSQITDVPIPSSQFNGGSGYSASGFTMGTMSGSRINGGVITGTGTGTNISLSNSGMILLTANNSVSINGGGAYFDATSPTATISATTIKLGATGTLEVYGAGGYSSGVTGSSSINSNVAIRAVKGVITELNNVTVSASTSGRSGSYTVYERTGNSTWVFSNGLVKSITYTSL